MIIVGITGVIGTGKSTLSDMLRARGFPVIDIDKLGREASSNKDVLKAVEDALGGGLIKDDTIDRVAMKNLVFGDAGALKTIEDIIHPVVHVAMHKALAELSNAGARVAIIDHPLLFETGLYKKCQKVVVVSAGTETTRARLKARGITEDDMARRLRFQIPLAEKEARADFVVHNDGTMKDLEGECLKLEAAIEKWEEQ
jgi:dephospho-CoA kinase